MQTEEGKQRQTDGAEVSRDHIHFAVGEVNHANNAVHHGVTNGYQSVN